MENGNLKLALNIIDVVFGFLAFITVEYILLCCRYAFQASMLPSLFLHCVNIFIMYKHCDQLSRVILKEKHSSGLTILVYAAVLVPCYIACRVFVGSFGYLDVAPVLKKLR